MKPYRILLTLFIACVIASNSNAQTKKINSRLTEESLVKDSAGNVYPYAVWSKLWWHGDCSFRVENSQDENSAFIMHFNSKQEREKVISSWPKPGESEQFKPGTTFANFKDKAIDGYKADTKALLGKIVVLNFWFIGCPPCREEIPDLNDLAMRYSNNIDVVFLSICLDEGYDIKNYTKQHPLAFHIIDKGQFLAAKFRVNLFPTNVVINREGKVAYSSNGGSAANPVWMQKTIDAALASPAPAAVGQ
ncbi:TlpA family protein disulfide reductase [Mucilaginibacter ginkgonis]|uniref:TlpA family protein disulfide reductase n=1 Tax=Mucilaginibacter ginkgonis TaxID=2682091 RepID=A0A6I4HZ11_9SPHI|nr:TlpA disulfide reductase family protein [Mucilaginibacter ginkgonis]QQL48584.1 TlpA family protein disulfide reductase [Mucilaginibacter ginkgonis]